MEVANDPLFWEGGSGQTIVPRVWLSHLPILMNPPQCRYFSFSSVTWEYSQLMLELPQQDIKRLPFVFPSILMRLYFNTHEIAKKGHPLTVQSGAESRETSPTAPLFLLLVYRTYSALQLKGVTSSTSFPNISVELSQENELLWWEICGNSVARSER